MEDAQEYWGALGTQEKFAHIKTILEQSYAEADELVRSGRSMEAPDNVKTDAIIRAIELAKIKHAFRGAALTLLTYKVAYPQQDIRAHKAEYEGGFSARSFDSSVTVPFLIERSLPRSVETHWLTQTLSFAGPLTSELQLKTTPKDAGPKLIQVVNDANNDATGATARAMVKAILIELIHIRNQSKVDLTRPKNLPIHRIRDLLISHMTAGYKSGAPRLPQLAIYAVYMCLVKEIRRFEGKTLEPLQRLKSADRKAGTVGDIVVSDGSTPVEAVEIKFDQPISLIHVMEAMDKVRSESVSRYYLLSTAGIEANDASQINEKKDAFLKQNGCEIIVNGVVDTISYYLRLLPETTSFVKNYADLLETDEDTGYEHRIKWNDLCEKI